LKEGYYEEFMAQLKKMEYGYQGITMNLKNYVNEPYMVKVIKVRQLRWMGHLFRMQEQNPCRKLTLHKPEGTRRVGKPAIRWSDSVEDLKTTSVRN
jgi:hypothetical protein